MLDMFDWFDERILDDRRETYAANLRLCGRLEYSGYIHLQM